MSAMEEGNPERSFEIMPSTTSEHEETMMHFHLDADTEQYDESKTFSQELRNHIDKQLFVFEYSDEVNRKTVKRYETLEAEEGLLNTPIGLESHERVELENVSDCTVTENHKTPHSNKRATVASTSGYVDDALPTKIQIDRPTPLPILNFADSADVWQNMVYKEQATAKLRNSKAFSDRGSCLPRMRAVLLDWVMEVCEVYHLRRTTYYLTVDYIDRYLTIKPSVPKTQLQLLGVSCLFIASKLEEIYPPKLSEFSYVCDGACTESDILSCEILLLNTLGWDINPMTPTSWLNLYMQIYYNAENLKKQRLHEGVNNSFQFPQYSAYKFVKASHIIDLFSMDPGFLRFPYGMIAAGAMHYIFGAEVALTVSGYSWENIKDCVEYMSVFPKLIGNIDDPRLLCVSTQELDDKQTVEFSSIRKKVPNLIANERHCMQTHIIDLDYFEKITLLRLNGLGYNIDKVLLKKHKTPISSTSNDQEEHDENQNTEQPESETTVVVYEIEKNEGSNDGEMPFLNLSQPKCIDEFFDDVMSKNKNVNILKIKEKTKLTLDEILSSLHIDYYDKKYKRERL